MDNRGKMQAQGRNVQESVPWNQDDPPTQDDGHAMLDALRDRLPAREAEFRERGFAQAHVFVDRMAVIGGAGPAPPPIIKSYPQPPLRHGRRVDIEVNHGRAFVPNQEADNNK